MGHAVRIVFAILVWCIPGQAWAQASSGKTEERPVLFLANELLPPLNFLKDGKPTGLVVDLIYVLS